MYSRKVKENSQDLFFISSSDWEAVVEASDSTEAATRALEERMEEFPESTNISSIILALNITKELAESSGGDKIELLYAPKILANAGLHEESKKLQTIIEEISILKWSRVKL